MNHMPFLTLCELCIFSVKSHHVVIKESFKRVYKLEKYLL